MNKGDIRELIFRQQIHHFITSPTFCERRSILSSQLRRGLGDRIADLDLDLDTMSKMAHNFSRGEIVYAVNQGLYAASSEERDPTTEDIVLEIVEIRLSKEMSL